MLRFTLLFIILLPAMFFLSVLGPVDRHVVEPFTGVLAKISTFLIGFFDSDAIARGKEIRSLSNGFAVSIERGCNGIEAVIILAAAILAFPAPWKHKLAGFAAGFVAIQSLNLVRIISLFYLGQWSMVWFEWFHLYLWQALIILDALVVWLLWLRWLPPASPPEPPSEPPAAVPA